MHVHVHGVAVVGGRERGCEIGGGRCVGEESALVDGARVDTEVVGSEGGSAASRETSVAVATGGVDYHVHSHCRQACQGDASGGTGMPFRTLGKNPCARAAGDVSACGKWGSVKIWKCGAGVGEERKRVRTGAIMLPRTRRRPCTWASR